MTMHTPLLACTLALTLMACGEGSSTGTAPQTAHGGGASGARGDSSADSSKGFGQTVLDFVFSNPRKDRQASPQSACSPDRDYTGRALPFHTVAIDNGNDFNTTNEAFDTSTPEAQTPYVAYATWDPCTFTVGLTGSAVGAGDCAGDECPVVDEGESPYRYWMVYLDTDPEGTAGTNQPRDLGSAPEALPFRADYLLEIRLDGVTQQVGDGYTYQGNAQLYSRSSDWRVGLENSWQPQGRRALEIGDNSSSNFLEVAIARSALGDPCAVRTIGWVTDTHADTSFAFWPAPRRKAAADSTRRDSLALDHYGFALVADQQPNASGNLNRTDFSMVERGCTGATAQSE